MDLDQEDANQSPLSEELARDRPDAGAGDAELVASICEGDERAFEILFERHKLRVGAIAGRFFQDHVDDIIQECFTRAYFALPDFNAGNEGAFAGWLAKIAFNTCYDEMRRRSRRRESLLGDLAEPELQTLRGLISESGTESGAIGRDLANKLLANLSAEDRLVLVMLDVEGLSVNEISRTMGWSVPKVKVRVFRARADLRRILRKYL